jgi:sorting nexin-41/42
MWNDEDNNPYGTSFDRRDPLTSSANPASPSARECTKAVSYLPSAAVRNFGGVALEDDCGSADDDWEVLDARFDVPNTPSTTSDDGGHQVPSFVRDDTDVDSDDGVDRDPGELVPRQKPGGYDSRVEQLLYENPNIPILITYAGKSLEGGGRYIAYTIRTGVCTSAIHLEVLADLICRIWRCDGDTLSSPAFEMR